MRIALKVVVAWREADDEVPRLVGKLQEFARRRESLRAGIESGRKCTLCTPLLSVKRMRSPRCASIFAGLK